MGNHYTFQEYGKSEPTTIDGTEPCRELTDEEKEASRKWIARQDTKSLIAATICYVVIPALFCASIGYLVVTLAT